MELDTLLGALVNGAISGRSFRATPLHVDDKGRIAIAQSLCDLTSRKPARVIVASGRRQETTYLAIYDPHQFCRALRSHPLAYQGSQINILEPDAEGRVLIPAHQRAMIGAVGLLMAAPDEKHLELFAADKYVPYSTTPITSVTIDDSFVQLIDKIHAVENIPPRKLYSGQRVRAIDDRNRVLLSPAIDDALKNRGPIKLLAVPSSRNGLNYLAIIDHFLYKLLSKHYSSDPRFSEFLSRAYATSYGSASMRLPSAPRGKIGAFFHEPVCDSLTYSVLIAAAPRLTHFEIWNPDNFRKQEPPLVDYAAFSLNS